MAKEIERKFLVTDSSFMNKVVSEKHIVQGYLSTDVRATIRVRIINDSAVITVKGKNEGAVRDEWEYPIPVDDARQILERISTGALIDKTRYIVKHDGKTWEIDSFHSPVDGLTVAEIELTDPEEQFSLPPFIGKEVTGDPAYYNSSIAKIAEKR